MSRKKTELETQRAVTLSHGCIDEKTYEIDDRFRTGQITPEGVHTTTELVALLEKDEKVQLDALVLCVGENGSGVKRLNRAKFLENWKKNARKTNFKKALESFDAPGSGGWNAQTGANLIGDDYTPILGGPFNKQLYLHDMLRMISLSFFAYHHDPVAHAIVHITKDFTLGRGFRVDSDNDAAMAVWRAFEKVNDLQRFFEYIAIELSTYGEIFVHWLPNGQPYNEWQLPAAQIPKPVILPRLRLMDPSTVWEIITYPEDITRVLAYQQVFPTQYQIYTTQDKGEVVPGSKFIIQQVPASQVDHFTVNCVSNEKRGRSDLYPALGYLKRLRDTVQYSVVAMQKNAAWAIDTTIEGSQTDLENYVTDQNSQRTIAPAGSEFVHTKKITRNYLSNTNSHSGNVSAFEWCLNMICAAVQIPVSYLGTHLSGGQTRASAMVGTEPVTKKFEARQLVYEDIIQTFWTRLMTMADIKNEDGTRPECEITFPELISQDRTAKIKDTALAQELDIISHETMSNICAKELGISTYDYDSEQEKIKAERAEDFASQKFAINPLTAIPAVPAGSPGDSGPKASQTNPIAGAASADGGASAPKPSAVTKTDRAKVAANQGA